MNKQIYTVTQINRYIKRVFENDGLLNGLYITGELSNVKIHTSGHIYFTLKDEKAAVSAVMFSSSAQSLAFTPKNGMNVIVFGYVSLYEKTGQYQIYAEIIEPAGIGSLQAAFIELRDRLQAEGLFDAKHKKPIPKYVKCVAVVTSPTGAAVQDIIKTIKNLNPAVKIVVAPALVQGKESAKDIARAIYEVNQWAGADVMIVGRGGGSLEDLQAFNEEICARAIFGSTIPVISAVGHETDFTISDFAADLRAPTPTAAAAIAVTSQQEMAATVVNLLSSLHSYMNKKLDDCKHRYTLAINNRAIKTPLQPIYELQGYIQTLISSMSRDIGEKHKNEQKKLEHLTINLENLSPYSVWKRGYAMVQNDMGETLTKAAGLKAGDMLQISFLDGCARTEVKDINMKEQNLG